MSSNLGTQKGGPPSGPSESSSNNPRMMSFVQSLLEWSLDLYQDNYRLKMGYKPFYGLTGRELKGQDRERVTAQQVNMLNELKSEMRFKLNAPKNMKLFDIVNFIKLFAENEIENIQNPEIEPNRLEAILNAQIVRLTTAPDFKKVLGQRLGELIESDYLTQIYNQIADDDEDEEDDEEEEVVRGGSSQRRTVDTIKQEFDDSCQELPLGQGLPVSGQPLPSGQLLQRLLTGQPSGQPATVPLGPGHQSSGQTPPSLPSIDHSNIHNQILTIRIPREMSTQTDSSRTTQTRSTQSDPTRTSSIKVQTAISTRSRKTQVNLDLATRPLTTARKTQTDLSLINVQDDESCPVCHRSNTKEDKVQKSSKVNSDNSSEIENDQNVVNSTISGQDGDDEAASVVSTISSSCASSAVTVAKKPKRISVLNDNTPQIRIKSEFDDIAAELIHSRTPSSRSTNPLTPIHSFELDCPFCVDDEPIHFVSIRLYMSHYIDHHQQSSSTEPWKCHTCEYVFASRDTFVAHVKSSDCFKTANARKYECMYCEQRFKRAYHLKAHLTGVHRKELKKLGNKNRIKGELEEGEKELDDDTPRLARRVGDGQSKKMTNLMDVEVDTDNTEDDALSATTQGLSRIFDTERKNRKDCEEDSTQQAAATPKVHLRSVVELREKIRNKMTNNSKEVNVDTEPKRNNRKEDNDPMVSTPQIVDENTRKNTRNASHGNSQEELVVDTHAVEDSLTTTKGLSRRADDEQRKKNRKEKDSLVANPGLSRTTVTTPQLHERTRKNRKASHGNSQEELVVDTREGEDSLATITKGLSRRSDDNEQNRKEKENSLATPELSQTAATVTLQDQNARKNNRNASHRNSQEELVVDTNEGEDSLDTPGVSRTAATPRVDEITRKNRKEVDADHLATVATPQVHEKTQNNRKASNRKNSQEELVVDTNEGEQDSHVTTTPQVDQTTSQKNRKASQRNSVGEKDADPLVETPGLSRTVATAITPNVDQRSDELPQKNVTNKDDDELDADTEEDDDPPVTTEEFFRKFDAERKRKSRMEGEQVVHPLQVDQRKNRKEGEKDPLAVTTPQVNQSKNHKASNSEEVLVMVDTPEGKDTQVTSGLARKSDVERKKTRDAESTTPQVQHQRSAKNRKGSKDVDTREVVENSPATATTTPQVQRSAKNRKDKKKVEAVPQESKSNSKKVVAPEDTPTLIPQKRKNYPPVRRSARLKDPQQEDDQLLGPSVTRASVKRPLELQESTSTSNPSTPTITTTTAAHDQDSASSGTQGKSTRKALKESKFLSAMLSRGQPRPLTAEAFPKLPPKKLSDDPDEPDMVPETPEPSPGAQPQAPSTFPASTSITKQNPKNSKDSKIRQNSKDPKNLNNSINHKNSMNPKNANNPKRKPIRKPLEFEDANGSPIPIGKDSSKDLPPPSPVERTSRASSTLEDSLEDRPLPFGFTTPFPRHQKRKLKQNPKVHRETPDPKGSIITTKGPHDLFDRPPPAESIAIGIPPPRMSSPELNFFAGILMEPSSPIFPVFDHQTDQDIVQPLEHKDSGSKKVEDSSSKVKESGSKDEGSKVKDKSSKVEDSVCKKRRQEDVPKEAPLPKKKKRRDILASDSEEDLDDFFID